MSKRQSRDRKTVETITHTDATRRNIPTAEYQSVLDGRNLSDVRAAYERRNRDLDPQLVWRGKDEQDWGDLVVQAPALYIQEKVHPKALIDDLMRQSVPSVSARAEQLDLFADFNGIPEGADRTDFYQHDQNWSNRMILGDSLQVMASLTEREGLRGKVQCIYIDPPYGIKFNSNFQWSTGTRNVQDGNPSHITREPEQVKAFRDTWRDEIHSYLTYLRDRFTVARDLLAESGSIFVQIGDENVHRVRALLDEVFGPDNFCSLIFFSKTTGTSSGILPVIGDIIIWYAKSRESVKFRQLLRRLPIGDQVEGEFKNVILPDLRRRRLTADEQANPSLIPDGAQLYRTNTAVSPEASATLTKEIVFMCGVRKHCGENRHWKTGEVGLCRLEKAGRLDFTQGPTRMYLRFFADNEFASITNVWTDTRSEQKQVYVVQTKDEVIKRCVLMASDPGDLVVDPTCGSGTTAYVSEQWGRRWITIDTSRVALALARARIMGARYPYYLLADSREGRAKDAEISRAPTRSSHPVHGSIRHGFVYQRVPHIQLSDIAGNSEIDVIWDRWKAVLEPHRDAINDGLGKRWEEWDIPREERPEWTEAARQAHADWWRARIGRQQEIDASIADKSEFEYLYDQPYEDRRIVRVAGPFTVESLSPHRVLTINEDGEFIDGLAETASDSVATQSFPQMILENLRTAGVQQAHKDDRITFTSLVPWPGDLICGDGRYIEGKADSGIEKRAGIFVGPEFGTVTRPDLVEAAREAADAGFDVLIACAFNYEAHATEFSKLGRLTVLKARMNADLQMSADLKNTGKGNLFVIFGEPDIELLRASDGLRVRIKGVDVFHPSTGEVRSDGPEGIACWLVDTDYNEGSFFVRHAYFLGANDPYSALKTTLKAEIDADSWATLNSDTSRPFSRPESGRIAVKVINHLGDEVMKVFRVQ
jgi:adenine-specific DNA-methyltransferase